MTMCNGKCKTLSFLYSVILFSRIYPNEIIHQNQYLNLQRKYALWARPKNLIKREWFSQWQNFHSLENYRLKTGHSESLVSMKNM